MKTFRLISGLLVAALAAAGCSSLDVNRGGNPDRVLSGTVNAGTALPPGAQITVRLVAPAMNNDASRPALNDIPVVARPTVQAPERVLGEYTQTLSAGTSEPVPFRIEYNADDALLRRGIALEARVSMDGRLRYRTINAHVVTLGSSPYRQEINVQPVQ
jgi:uncharacterized lipoprotein YbaY